VVQDDHEAWNNLGNVLLRLGQRGEAVDAYRRALDLRPDYHPSWNNLGNALEEAGDLDGAAEAYALAVERMPLRPMYLLNHASVLARIGRTEQAVDVLAAAVGLAPGIRGLLCGFPEFNLLLRHPKLRRAPG
jgi:tetratricopeptide (TPR) repeat protein